MAGLGGFLTHGLIIDRHFLAFPISAFQHPKNIAGGRHGFIEENRRGK